MKAGGMEGEEMRENIKEEEEEKGRCTKERREQKKL